jgi:uncharacterized protein involved in tolerance to divalent cations
MTTRIIHIRDREHFYQVLQLGIYGCVVSSRDTVVTLYPNAILKKTSFKTPEELQKEVIQNIKECPITYIIFFNIATRRYEYMRWVDHRYMKPMYLATNADIERACKDWL